MRCRGSTGSPRTEGLLRTDGLPPTDRVTATGLLSESLDKESDQDAYDGKECRDHRPLHPLDVAGWVFQGAFEAANAFFGWDGGHGSARERLISNGTGFGPCIEYGGGLFAGKTDSGADAQGNTLTLALSRRGRGVDSGKRRYFLEGSK